MNLDALLIIVFMLANLYIGMRAGKKIETIDHFSVGHRSFSTFLIFATLSATFIGGGYTLGNSAKVFSSGLIYSFALLGFSLQQILVALVIAPRMDAHRDCLSIGDIIAKRYGVVAKVITGIFSLLVCSGILGAQVGAMGAIFQTFFNVDPAIGIFIGFGIIIAYSSTGGMRAVVFTDALQFVVLVIGIPLTFILGLYYVGGFSKLIDSAPYHHVAFIQSKGDILKFISLFITFIFGETLVPPYVQRLFMAKSAEHTKTATLMSGLLSIPFFLIAGAIGLIALVIDPSIESNSALPFVVQTTLPVLAKGFVIAGIISIIMSSAAGFLNAAAVAFVNDIVKPMASSPLTEKRLLWLARLSTVVVGLGAVVFALMINNLLSILLYAYNFWAPVILVPLVAVILNLNVHKRDFLFGAVAGVLMMLWWSVLLDEPYQISAVVMGVFANFISFSCSYSFNRGNRFVTEIEG